MASTASRLTAAASDFLAAAASAEPLLDQVARWLMPDGEPIAADAPGPLRAAMVDGSITRRRTGGAVHRRRVLLILNAGLLMSALSLPRFIVWPTKSVSLHCNARSYGLILRFLMGLHRLRLRLAPSGVLLSAASDITIR